MQIIYARRAIKAIESLDIITRRRVRNGVEKLPSGDIKKLKGYSTAFRLRVGDYRVLFDMENGIIKVNDVLPRSEAYR